MATVKTLVAALFLAVVSGSQPPGRLFVHMSPGFEVIVDGAATGLTTADVGGKIIDVNPGSHHVVVRSSDGREGSFDVTIESGQTRDVTLSPLGLRRKLVASDEPSSLHIVCVPEDCSVTLGEKHTEMTVEAVPAGQYPLAVTRGTSTLRMNADIPANTIVTVEANFTAGTIRVTDSRRRARRLVLTEANDALTALAVPPQWKGAIRGALPAGIYIANASIIGNGVKVTMRVPSEDVAVSMIRGIARSNAFTNISVPSQPRREGTAWILDLIFDFPAGR